MKKLLLTFFATVLISMLLTCFWAGSHQNMFDYFNEQGSNPWFVATLMDCYWGFFIFYLWLVYKENSWLIRIPWLIAIVCLGNIAIATSAIVKVVRLPSDASVEDFLLKQKPTNRASA